MMDSVTTAAEQAWRVVKDLATSYGRPTARWLTDVRDRIQESGWSMDWFRKKARDAGKKVRDAFKGVYDYLKDISEGRDLDWEGIKGALGEVKNDAMVKATEAWDSIKSTLWPKIKTAFKNLLNDLWGMIGEKVAGLPRLIGSELQDIARRQMQKTMEEVENKKDKLGEEALKAMGSPGGMFFGETRVSPLRVLRQLTGGMSTSNRVKMQLWESLAGAGDMLVGAGAAGQQTARNAQRRRRRRRHLEGLRGPGRELMEKVLRARSGGLQPREWAELIPAIRKAAEKMGETDTEQRHAFTETKGLLEQMNRDLEIQKEQLQKFRRTLRRLSTARQ
jgi:hypothetical protein